MKHLHNKLHQEGNKHHKEFLIKERDSEIKKLKESKISLPKKLGLLARIKARYRKLIKDTDQNLYLDTSNA